MLTEDQKDDLLKYIAAKTNETKGISGKDKTKLKESLLPLVNEYLVKLVRKDETRRRQVQEFLNNYLPFMEGDEKLSWLELFEQEIIYILSKSTYSMWINSFDDVVVQVTALTKSIKKIEDYMKPPVNPVPPIKPLPDLYAAHPKHR